MLKKNPIALCLLSLAAISSGAMLYAAVQRGLGYSDTPIITGTNWHVHDGERPQPRIVAPAATFSHNAPAPADAVALFDGKDLSKWQSGNGRPAAWRIDTAGFMETGRGGIRTKDRFADFQLHLEFATPSEVSGEGQGRGNSGVFLMDYEVQVLDSVTTTRPIPTASAAPSTARQSALVNACRSARRVADLRHHLRVAPMGRGRQAGQECQRDRAAKRPGAASQTGVFGSHRRRRRRAAHGPRLLPAATSARGFHRVAGPRQSAALSKYMDQALGRIRQAAASGEPAANA